jgi:hypothetical protein
MTDAKIRAAWADCYPKWRTDANAAKVCQSICKLIIERAEESTILGTIERQIMYLCQISAFRNLSLRKCGEALAE